MNRPTLTCLGMMVLCLAPVSVKAQDVALRLVALSSPSTVDRTTSLPASIGSVLVGDTYYLELWCSDVGTLNSGVTSAYVDLAWNAGPASAASIDHTSLYSVFASGVIQNGFIDELGGSTVQQIAIEPEWARVVVVEVVADLGGEVTFSALRSSTGVAAWDRGKIPWSVVELDDITVIHVCTVNADCDDSINCTIDSCDGGLCVYIPSASEGPVLVHGNGMKGETRPFTGYVDPRSESSNGSSLDRGLKEVTLLFSDPVRSVGGNPLTTASFLATTTKGTPPIIAAMDDTQNPLIRLIISTSPPLGEWTTIRANVEDVCGNPIVDMGNLGPGAEEPDRLDFLFLPGDADQSGVVQPIDLLRLRQYLSGVAIPANGELLDYIDINRDGMFTPIDFLRFRQLLTGVSPSTRRWLGGSAESPQP